MISQYSRRNALQIVGSSAVLALAGCTTPEKQNESQNQTQFQEPTRDDFAFDINIEKQFKQKIIPLGLTSHCQTFLTARLLYLQVQLHHLQLI